MGSRLGRSVPLAVVLALSALRGEAHGAPRPSSPSGDRALDLFEQSARAYREGRFQDAVDKLLEARKLKPEAVLLYNLARAYEALGRSEDAADAYAQYLAEEPAAVDRKAIEGRVTTLRAQAAELAAARKPEPKPIASRPADPSSPIAPAEPKAEESSAALAVVPWIALGTGAAVMAAGLVMGGVASAKHDDAVAEPEQRAAVRKQGDATSLAEASTITIIVGAVVAAVGMGWIGYRMATSRSSTSRANAPAAAQTSHPFALRWTF